MATAKHALAEAKAELRAARTVLRANAAALASVAATDTPADLAERTAGLVTNAERVKTWTDKLAELRPQESKP